MRPCVIPTTLACLLASVSAVSAGGPRGHALGAELARLSSGTAAPIPDLDNDRLADDDVAEAGAPCPAESEGACTAQGAAVDP